MLRWVTLLALLAALAPVGAEAATVGETATLVAGRPGDVACAEQTEWEALLRQSGHVASTAGLTWVNAGRIRFAPWVCQALARGRSGPALGPALNIVAHEAAHLRGIRDESTAACWGLAWAADLARRFYGIEFFTAESQAILAGAHAIHRTLPADYHRACR